MAELISKQQPATQLANTLYKIIGNFHFINIMAIAIFTCLAIAVSYTNNLIFISLAFPMLVFMATEFATTELRLVMLAHCKTKLNKTKGIISFITDWWKNIKDLPAQEVDLTKNVAKTLVRSAIYTSILWTAFGIPSFILTLKAFEFFFNTPFTIDISLLYETVAYVSAYTFSYSISKLHNMLKLNGPTIEKSSNTMRYPILICRYSQEVHSSQTARPMLRKILGKVQDRYFIDSILCDRSCSQSDELSFIYNYIEKATSGKSATRHISSAKPHIPTETRPLHC